MHPFSGFPAPHWASPCTTHTPAAPPPPRPLTPPECQEVLGQVQRTARQAYSFIAFLESKDPAADMPPDRRQDLKLRCLQAADTRHLADQWPQVGTGLQFYPSNRPLPAFTAHHQAQMLQRMSVLAGVARECDAMARARLETFLEPVRNELIAVDGLLSLLPGTYHLPAREDAIRLVRRLDDWRTAHDGHDCRIAASVVSLTTPRQPVSLRATREALEALMALRRGDDGRPSPLLAEQQPAYQAQWNRLFTLLEQDDLPAFHRELAVTQQWRRYLLQGSMEPFATPMPKDDPQPAPGGHVFGPE